MQDRRTKGEIEKAHLALDQDALESAIEGNHERKKFSALFEHEEHSGLKKGAEEGTNDGRKERTLQVVASFRSSMWTSISSPAALRERTLPLKTSDCSWFLLKVAFWFPAASRPCCVQATSTKKTNHSQTEGGTRQSGGGRCWQRPWLGCKRAVRRMQTRNRPPRPLPPAPGSPA